MKKYSLIILISAGICAVALTSCKGEKKQESLTNVTKEHYKCPMKCTEQIFDKPESCPVCGMDLENVTKL